MLFSIFIVCLAFNLFSNWIALARTRSEKSVNITVKNNSKVLDMKNRRLSIKILGSINNFKSFLKRKKFRKGVTCVLTDIL